MVVLGRSYGHVFDDGEARSTIGAIDERVTVAAIGRVEEFTQAIRAGAYIWRYGLEGALNGFGVQDVKGTETIRGMEREVPIHQYGKASGHPPAKL